MEPTGKRRYRMGARAAAAAHTRERILQAARELFMAAPFFDDVSLEQIAERTGFGHPERMRRAFVRAFGAPPSVLRRKSHHNTNARARPPN